MKKKTLVLLLPCLLLVSCGEEALNKEAVVNLKSSIVETNNTLAQTGFVVDGSGKVNANITIPTGTAGLTITGKIDGEASYEVYSFNSSIVGKTSVKLNRTGIFASTGSTKNNDDYSVEFAAFKNGTENIFAFDIKNNTVEGSSLKYYVKLSSLAYVLDGIVDFSKVDLNSLEMKKLTEMYIDSFYEFATSAENVEITGSKSNAGTVLTAKNGQISETQEGINVTGSAEVSLSLNKDNVVNGIMGSSTFDLGEYGSGKVEAKSSINTFTSTKELPDITTGYTEITKDQVKEIYMYIVELISTLIPKA